MQAFTTMKKMHLGALKRGFLNFQSLFDFGLTTDDTTLTTNLKFLDLLG